MIPDRAFEHFDKNSLETALKSLTLSLVRRIGDAFPFLNFRHPICGDFGVDAVRSLIRSEVSERFFSFLYEGGRADLTFELHVLRPPWSLLFDTEERNIACERLKRALDGAVVLNLKILCEREVLLEESGLSDSDWLGIARQNFISNTSYSEADLLNLAKRRAEEYRDLDVADQIRQLGVELQAGYPFTPFAQHRDFLAELEPDEESLLVGRAFEKFDNDELRTVISGAKQLQIAWDRSEARVDKLLTAQLAEFNWTTNENPGDRWTSRKVACGTLAEAAVTLARCIGKRMHQYAKTHSTHRIWECARQGHGQPHIVQVVQDLTGGEFLAIMVAQLIRNAFMYAPEYSCVVSFGDIQSVEGLFEIVGVQNPEDWNPDWDDDIRAPDLALDHMAFLDMAIAAAQYRIRELGSPSASRPGILLPPEQHLVVSGCTAPVAFSESESIERHSSLVGIGSLICRLTDAVESQNALQIPTIDLLERIVVGVDRIDKKVEAIGGRNAEAQQSLLGAIGPEVFEGLCAHARTALIGAEYSLADPGLPDPTQIILGIAIAFERQLNASIMGPLCESLRERGVSEYPVGEHRPKLLRYGEQEDRLTLEQLLRILQMQDPLLEECFAANRLNRGKVLNAIRRVKRYRNTAAHEGAFGREFARQLRNEWLHHDRGVFRALLPG